MDNQPEFWVYVLANTGLFVVGSVLAGLSFLAYRRSDGERSYRLATVGFGFVVLGGLVEPFYLFIIQKNETITETEMLLLQAGEGTLLTFGLGALFYGITQHDTSVPPNNGDEAPQTTEFTYTLERTGRNN